MAERIEIMLSWMCNNNCIFCGESENRQKAIENKILVRNIDNIKSELLIGRKQGAAHVTFLGGEPTIYKDLFKAAAFAKQNNYKTIFLATNARMCSNEKFANKLINAGINEVSVSIHGHTCEIHDSCTTITGSFTQTIKGLENLLKYTKVMTNTTICRNNYKYLPEIIDFLNKYKIEMNLITYPHLTGNAKNPENIPGLKECKKYVQEAILRSKHKIRIMNVPFCILEENYYYSDLINFTERKKISPLGNVESRYKTGVDYQKISVCSVCKFDFVCPGIHSTMPVSSFKDFSALSGLKLKSIT